MTGKIISNETPMALYSADKIHDFAFTPDLARAIAVGKRSLTE
jgi:hypothetical protein